MSASLLVPLPVALPLLVAGLLLTVSTVLPRRWDDVIAILTASAVAALGAFLAARALDGPLVHWFGAWTPRDGLVLGIGFVAAAAAGAAVAGFVGCCSRSPWSSPGASSRTRTRISTW